MPKFKFNKDKYNKDKLNKPHPITAAYEDTKYAAPNQEAVGSNSSTLQAKAYRSLSNVGVIDVKADPNAEMSYGAFPYTIIGATSPVVDAKYPGYENIAGNAITQIQNDTTKSQLMNIFDVGVISKKVNYNYLPIRPSGVNVAYAGEMIKSIEQAVSFGFSTMLTQLPFSLATYATDLPIPLQYIDPATAEGATGLNRKLDKAAGYYAAMVHYQCVLQSLVQPISKYIELRSLEKEMMRMSFRTEAPLLTQLFGLFKKTSFISEINTIGTVVINEYFDRNWYMQNNTLQCVPSRKTKGMVDPLLTMVATHAIPDLTITENGAVTYKYADLKTGEASLLDPDTFAFTKVTLSLEQLIERVCKLLNPAYILRFLRLMNRSDLPNAPEGSNPCQTVSAYGEGVKVYLSYISRFAARFSTAMSNIRTFLDKLSQSNLTYWKKGVSFFVDKIQQLEPHYNALLNDVFAATYSGADIVKFDNLTKRWRAYAFWNKYTGIPEFDRVSGGCFLTLGLREISTTDSAGNTVDFNSSAGLIPLLFTTDAADTTSLVVTRTGASASLVKNSITNAALKSDPYLVRLNVMSDPNISLKQPSLVTTISNAELRAKFASSALLLLGNTFGYGVVKYNNNVVAQAMDPDYVAFIDLEIEDVSNQMIVYARNYAPFRVDTPDASRTMGFTKK